MAWQERDWAKRPVPKLHQPDKDDDEPKGWVYLPTKADKAPCGWMELTGMVRDNVSRVLVETEPMTLTEAAQVVAILHNLTSAAHNALQLDRADKLDSLSIDLGDDDDEPDTAA